MGGRIGVIGELVQELLILYFFSFIGFIMAKVHVLNKDANEILSRLILNITLPSLIISSLNIPFSYDMIKEFYWLLFLSVYILVLSILLATWMGKQLNKTPKKRPVYESLIIFGNQGFIGYAIIFVLFGSEGIIYLVIFNIIYLILIWTYGIYLFTKNKEVINLKGLVNPGIISTMIGLILFLFPIKTPNFASIVLEETGKMTIPLSMIFIGSLLATVHLKELMRLSKDIYLWKAVIVKLIVIPFLFAPLIFFSIPTHLILVAFIVSGMPSAPTVSLYSQKYKADTFFASTTVLISTILCVFTIPLLIAVFKLVYNI